MSEFNSPPSRFYEPPNYHEVCKCDECHLARAHDIEDAKFWATHGCDGCYDVLDQERQIH